MFGSYPSRNCFVLEQLNSQSVLLYFLRLGLGIEAKDDSLSSESRINWDSVYKESVHQDVAPIVFDGYTHLFDEGGAVPPMPADFKKQWIGLSFQLEQKAELQRKRAQEMAGLFWENSIRTYVLKGFVFSECYPIPSHRRSSDLDCYLRSLDEGVNDVWEKGNSLIEKSGWKVSRHYYKNSTFRKPGLMVENHLFFTPFRGNKRLTSLERLLQQLMAEDEGKDKFDGMDLYRPPVMASALFLIEHAFSHFLHEGLTLRHITDWVMFRRKHENDIDWPQFHRYVDAFGFRRFYEAYVHVGEYIMGDCSFESLTLPEQQMMLSVWEGLDLHKERTGVRSKLNLVGNTIRAHWKYRYFSPISMFHALWIQIKGFFFIKNPTLG